MSILPFLRSPPQCEERTPNSVPSLESAAPRRSAKLPPKYMRQVYAMGALAVNRPG
jgi:hypothetical protein